jgi:plastocyanin
MLNTKEKQMVRLLAMGVGLLLLGSTLEPTYAGVPAASNRQAPAVAAAGSARTWQVIVGADSPDHAIMAMGYLPADLYIDVGDIVVWTSRSMEMHTVTFQQRGTQPPDYAPGVVSLAGGPRYDGTSYASSDPMTARARAYYVDSTVPTYRLTFVKPGTFTYLDVLYHGLKGQVHVRPAGTAYPLSPAQVKAAAARQIAASMVQGHTLSVRAAHESNDLNVTAGIGNGHVSVNRFFPSNLVVHVGDTVTFTNRDPINVHTVTFDTTQEGDPTTQTGGSPATFDGSVLASGLLGTAQEFGPNYAKSYQIRFVKAGHFTYYCDLNDDLGMKGTVDVVR